MLKWLIYYNIVDMRESLKIPQSIFQSSFSDFVQLYLITNLTLLSSYKAHRYFYSKIPKAYLPFLRRDYLYLEFASTHTCCHVNQLYCLISN